MYSYSCKHVDSRVKVARCSSSRCQRWPSWTGRYSCQQPCQLCSHSRSSHFNWKGLLSVTAYMSN